MRRLMLLSLSALLWTACAQSHPPLTPTYRNPLKITDSAGGQIESCADPSIIHSRVSGDTNWYLYCTSDPHSERDLNPDGSPHLHLISVAKSKDLVNWSFIGDAFAQRPDWVAADAGLWAPDTEYIGGKYYLYYTASETRAGGSAIGVAVSDSPAGPWKDSGRAVVEPHAPPSGNDPAFRRWVFDPDVIFDAAGQGWLYYGSYYGGISVRRLSADGLSTDPASEVQVATDNRYEGTQVTFHGGYYYLMASATDCCRGPLTGYSVFAGRSTSPTGPFTDRDGVSLLAARTGGTPMLSLNGNRWVGPGHHAVFTDAGGQDWVVYHAIDQQDPYFTPGGINKRPALLDPLDWLGGWPTVRAGRWASDELMPAPAAQAGEHTLYRPESPLASDEVAAPLDNYSDTFNGNALSSAWSWVRPPASGVQVANNAVSWETQGADLHEDSNNASVLTRPAPAGDYAVQVKVTLNVPAEGCCQNYVQGGLFIYGDDDHYLKLSVVSIWNTRQIEWAKETVPALSGYPRYGNTVLGAPGQITWLRIVRRGERYTAYSSTDGQRWQRGGTWTHQLGQARIGLAALGGEGFRAEFSDLRTFTLKKL